MQEAITLVVFMGFAAFWLGEGIQGKYLVSFTLIVAAVAIPMKSRFAILLFILAAAAYGGYRFFGTDGEQPRYKLAKAESGPITAVVSATGTLNPVVSVQVGSQVSG